MVGGLADMLHSRRLSNFTGYISFLVWAGFLPIFTHILVSLSKLVATEGISLPRTMQILFVAVHFINATLALKLEVSRLISGHTSRWHTAHKYVLSTVRLCLQCSYSFFPLGSDVPQIDQLSLQLHMDGVDLLMTENKQDRKYVLSTWLGFPMYVFLDWRYAFLNSLLLGTDQSGNQTYGIYHYLQTRGALLLVTKLTLTVILPAMRSGAAKGHRWILNSFAEWCIVISGIMSTVRIMAGQRTVPILEVVFITYVVGILLLVNSETLAESLHQWDNTSPPPTLASDQGEGNNKSKGNEDLMQEVKKVAESVDARGGMGGGGDKLEMLHPIGGGANGTVFKGRWRNMDVAVKTVLFPFEYGSSSAAAKQRAILEAGVSCSVSHPNIVATYHYDIKAMSYSKSSPVEDNKEGGGLQLDYSSSNHGRDWKLFLVQELCEASLEKAMEAGGLLHTLDFNKSFIPEGGWKQGYVEKKMACLLTLYGCLVDIASGMEYLHERNIIHADLKPENVLVKRDFKRPHGFTCKITDFGLSAMMDPKKTHVSNFRHGTVFYMAPEIFTGQATTASDVYSFGMLMTELYTGSHPWIYQEGQFLPNPLFLPQLEEIAPTQYVDIAKSCIVINAKDRLGFSQIKALLQTMLDREIERQTRKVAMRALEKI